MWGSACCPKVHSMLSYTVTRCPTLWCFRSRGQLWENVSDFSVSSAEENDDISTKPSLQFRCVFEHIFHVYRHATSALVYTKQGWLWKKVSRVLRERNSHQPHKGWREWCPSLWQHRAWQRRDRERSGQEDRLHALVLALPWTSGGGALGNITQLPPKWFKFSTFIKIWKSPAVFVLKNGLPHVHGLASCTHIYTDVHTWTHEGEEGRERVDGEWTEAKGWVEQTNWQRLDMI